LSGITIRKGKKRETLKRVRAIYFDDAVEERF
jgi:hypothetical protein